MPGSSAPARTCVVVVLYNSADVLEDCLGSILAGVEVVVVDNASTDGGADVAQRTRPDARVLRLPDNGGFGAGCNAGVAQSSRDIVVFLNPDARLHRDALDHMVAALDRSETGLVGPALVAADGSTEFTCRRWSTLAQDFAETLPSWRTWGPACLRRDLPEGAPIYACGGPTAYVQGACMAVARTHLDAIGGFDEDLFLYGEEESLALRLRAMGLHSSYVPTARVTHLGATSIDKVAHSADYHLRRSRVILYRKSRGRSLPVAAGLAAAVSMQLIVAVANALLGRGRHARCREAIVGMRGIWSGLTANLRDVPLYSRAR